MATNPRSTAGGAAPSVSVTFPRFDSSTSVLGSEVTHNRHSTVSFSGTTGTGRFSINRASALELHDLIYGSGNALNLANSESARAALDKLYEPSAVYSNPLLTASSGDVIKDIHSLMHQFTAVSIPTPLSVLGRFFRAKENVDWLTVAKVWSEVGEVLESDVYDGHRRVVIEHTVYLLFLPNVFPPDVGTTSDVMTIHGSASSLSLPDSLNSGTTGAGAGAGTSTNRHPTLGGVARMLTTLARQVSLPVHTRLSFNDSGRITHHQDIWDVKDVLGLVPGVGVAQWVGSRLFARGLATTFDVLDWASSSVSGAKKEGDETPRGAVYAGGGGYDSATPGAGGGGHNEFGSMRSFNRSRASSSSAAAVNALGLQLSDRLANVRGRAPDTDQDV